MTNEEQFVNELIGYIFAYPDDDYMTMECLCRKLVKYHLMSKVDGYYIADRKTEPQLTAKCLNCANGGSYKCSKCDGEMYFKGEPQRGCDADCNEDCTECAKEWQDWKDQMWTEAVIASQTENK